MLRVFGNHKGVKMPHYIHQGVVRPNGYVAPSQSVTDPTVLRLRPADDALRLASQEVGNFEWWYFDIIDARKGYVVKLVAHLGTNPLRTKCYPTVAVAAMTPNCTTVLMQPFLPEDFQASRVTCDVQIKDAFHTWVECAGETQTYHLTVSLPTFKVNLKFRSLLEGWRPLAEGVPMQKGHKKAVFSWVVPLPRAEVVGMFTMDGVDYAFEEALGYHDHNYWQVDTRAKLFIDDVVSHWYWGRFLGREYTIVFMDTCFRTHRLRSCLLAKDGAILHSSNNVVHVWTEHAQADEAMHTTYPARIRIALTEEQCALDMTMTLQAKAVIDRRDLLEGVSPLMKWFIRRLIATPAYHGVLADATVRIAGEEIHGEALYESMCFRST